MILDSDLFMVRPASLKEYMEDYAIIAVVKGTNGIKGGKVQEISYLWPGLMIFNMPILPDKKTINVNCGTVHGGITDAGGFTHYY